MSEFTIRYVGNSIGTMRVMISGDGKTWEDVPLHVHAAASFFAYSQRVIKWKRQQMRAAHLERKRRQKRSGR